MKIQIITEVIKSVTATLSDENPVTAKMIWDALPIEGKANIWGEEIYFSIPVKIEAENPKDVVNIGDLGYWPPGNAFCIFFGRTPVSRGNEIRPASPVNVFGVVDSDPKVFKKVKGGDKVRLEKA